MGLIFFFFIMTMMMASILGPAASVQLKRPRTLHLLQSDPDQLSLYRAPSNPNRSGGGKPLSSLILRAKSGHPQVKLSDTWHQSGSAHFVGSWKPDWNDDVQDDSGQIQMSSDKFHTLDCAPDAACSQIIPIDLDNPEPNLASTKLVSSSWSSNQPVSWTSDWPEEIRPDERQEISKPRPDVRTKAPDRITLGPSVATIHSGYHPALSPTTQPPTTTTSPTPTYTWLEPEQPSGYVRQSSSSYDPFIFHNSPMITKPIHDWTSLPAGSRQFVPKAEEIPLRNSITWKSSTMPPPPPSGHLHAHHQPAIFSYQKKDILSADFNDNFRVVSGYKKSATTPATMDNSYFPATQWTPPPRPAAEDQQSRHYFPVTSQMTYHPAAEEDRLDDLDSKPLTLMGNTFVGEPAHLNTGIYVTGNKYEDRYGWSQDPDPGRWTSLEAAKPTWQKESARASPSSTSQPDAPKGQWAADMKLQEAPFSRSSDAQKKWILVAKTIYKEKPSENEQPSSSSSSQSAVPTKRKVVRAKLGLKMQPPIITS